MNFKVKKVRIESPKEHKEPPQNQECEVSS